WYLAALVWLLYAVPFGDWLLRRNVHSDERSNWRYCRSAPGRERLLALGLAIAVLACSLSIMLTRFSDSAFFMWTPFLLLVLYLAGRRQHLVLHAWLVLVFTWLAWFVQDLLHSRLPA